MSALSKPEPSRSLQVEILDLRHFSSVDLRPLLEDEVREWARLLSWDYSGSAEMILRYVDAKILPGYAAIERGRIVGQTGIDCPGRAAAQGQDGSRSEADPGEF
ncbi:MAG TPA: hypothetical protein VEU11_09785 [Terriglobales bacterium]|nr:hypothetical protein [Terriglobales bacterium]